MENGMAALTNKYFSKSADISQGKKLLDKKVCFVSLFISF
jgi:hypothetical protein